MRIHEFRAGASGTGRKRLDLDGSRDGAVGLPEGAGWTCAQDISAAAEEGEVAEVVGLNVGELVGSVGGSITSPDLGRGTIGGCEQQRVSQHHAILDAIVKR